MNATDERTDSSPKLPTRSQLQAEAFGLSPRTPEWMKARRSAASGKGPTPKPPSADDTWVVAASRSDGWQLDRFAVLLERHAIDAEVDRVAGVLRVRRPALRAAGNLLRTHRRELRRSSGATERRVVDGTLLGMIGPPVVLGAAFFVSVSLLPQSRDFDLDRLVNAVLVLAFLTAAFTARAVLAGVRWLTPRSPAADGAPNRRDGADCPPAP